MDLFVDFAREPREYNQKNWEPSGRFHHQQIFTIPVLICEC